MTINSTRKHEELFPPKSWISVFILLQLLYCWYPWIHLVHIPVISWIFCIKMRILFLYKKRKLVGLLYLSVKHNKCSHCEFIFAYVFCCPTMWFSSMFIIHVVVHDIVYSYTETSWTLHNDWFGLTMMIMYALNPLSSIVLPKGMFGLYFIWSGISMKACRCDSILGHNQYLSESLVEGIH